MPLFKCPVCKRLHHYQDYENPSDVGCTDNVTSEVREITRENPDKFTANEWNTNKFSTNVSDYTNNVELVDVGRFNPHPRRVRNW